RAPRGRRRERSTDYRTFSQEMAALPFALAHTTASLRCNRGKSSAESTISAAAQARTLLHNVQLCFLVRNERIRRDALHQENVATNGATRADHGFAAQYG